MNRAGEQTRSTRRARARRIGLRSLAMGTAAALAVFGGATAAHAAPGDDSNATGTFLGGSVLGLIDLDALANLEGADATNDGVPDETVTEFNTLDLSVLGGVVTVTSPTGVQIPLGLGSLGVVGQYASAAPDGSSVGASGLVGEGGAVGTGVTPIPGQAPGPLSVDLTAAVDSLVGPGLAALVADLADVNLSVGAVSANATQAAPAGPVGDYTIAGADISVESATVAALSDSLEAAVAGLQTDLDALQGTLNGLLDGTLGALGLVDAGLTVDTTSLTAFVEDELSGELTSPDYPGVTINLDTGEILLDLAEIVDLNDLGIGEEVLSADTIAYIQEAVLDLVEGLVDDLVGSADTDPESGLIGAIRGLGVDGGATLLPILGDGIPLLDIDTTLGALLDGDAAGIEVLSGLVSAELVADLVAVLAAPVQTLLDELAPTLGAVLAPVNSIVLPAIDLVLPAVVSLTANNQSTPAPGVFSETALILTVLPLLGLDAVTLELANATVGPNALDTNADVTITAPTPDQPFFVPDPDDLADVTVAGNGQPGANITVVVNGVTQTVPVSAAPDAAWSATFTGLPVGSYTATATQDVDESSAEVDFTVDAAPDVDITAPGDGEEFAVAGPADEADVDVSGTGFPGSDIDVVVDGTTETTTVLGDGSWTVTFEDLPIGDYTATATQAFDGTTDEVDFSVVESEDVVIQSPEDGDEIVVDGPADLATVTVSGTGAPNATVEVSIPGLGDETALVDGLTGEWSVEFTGVPVDDYTATATQALDGSTDTVDFSVVAAADVDITAPTANQIIFVDGPADTAAVDVSGIGQEGETVTVTIPGQPTPAAVIVDADDEWSVTFPGLPVATYTATATQSDGSTDSVTFSVAAEEDVAIDSPTAGQVFGVPAAGGTIDVPVSGTGQSGAVVSVTVDGVTQDAPVVAGAWTTTFEDLAIGEYTAEAVQDVDGSTDDVDFSVAEIIDVEITDPVDGSVILVDTPASTTAVTVAGTGFEGATVSVTIPGQPGPLTDVVDADGTWSVEFPGLGTGGYTATAVQSGDSSTDATSFSIAAADDVLIDTPDEGERLLVAAPGDVRDVVVSGTGQIGLDVEVTIPGLGTETATVSPLGDRWTVTFEDVPEGDYTATAEQEDGSTDDVSFEVAAAEDIEIDQPTAGEVFPVDGPTSTEDVTISGTGEPFQDIEVTVDGEVRETTVLPDGSWSVIAEDLPVGAYTAEAVQFVEGDAESTDEVDFEVEAITDVAITSPADGDVFWVDGPGDTFDVVVSGTGYTGETVTVTIPGVPAQTSPVAGGAWSVTFPAVPVGDYTATAQQSGDASTDTVAFAVDDLPDVTIVAPEDGDVILVADDGDTASIEVSGTGAEGETVTVSIPGLPVAGPVTVDEDGNWEVTVPGVPEGEHVITATQSDGSQSSVEISVEVADDVVIEEPVDGEVIPADGTVDVDVSGIGQPGGIITIELDGEVVGTATVTPDGTWSETIVGVEPGEHTVDATQDLDGSTDSVDFEVEDIADVAIESPGQDEPFFVDGPDDTLALPVSGIGYTGETVTVSIPGLPDQTTVVAGGAWAVEFPAVPVGPHTVTAVQSGDGSTDAVDFEVFAEADVTITDPDDGDVIVVPNPGDTTDVEVCGTGQPGAEIIVTIGGLPPVTVIVDEETGAWCVTVPDVPEGEHEVVAEQPEDGSETTIVIVVEEAADVTIETPTDGEEVPATAPDATVDVPVTGTGEPGLPVVVVLDDGEEIETVVDEDGNWEVVFEDVPAGDHEVTATQPFDDSTDTVEFTVVDVVVAVDITSPVDGTQLNVPEEGDVLALVISGTGEPGAAVEVALTGVTDVQTDTVTPDGTWTVTFADQGVGTYTATATQDAAGEITTDTTTVSIAVAPIDTSKARADVTQQRIVRGPNATQTVVVTGFQPGETVSGTVYSTPFDLLPVIADSAGNARLTFAVGNDFQLGQHRVDIRGSITGELPAERENTAFVVIAAGALPATGSDGSGGLVLGGFGLSLLIAGAALWMVRRRTTTE